MGLNRHHKGGSIFQNVSSDRDHHASRKHSFCWGRDFPVLVRCWPQKQLHNYLELELYKSITKVGHENPMESWRKKCGKIINTVKKMDICNNIPQPPKRKCCDSWQTSVIFAARHLGSPYIWSMTLRNFSCTSHRRKVVLLEKRAAWFPSKT